MECQNLLSGQNRADQTINGCEPENVTGSSNEQPISFDILGQNSIPIKEGFLKNFAKETSENLDRGANRNCKIIRFSFEWNFDEIQTEISSLKQEEFPNLFIFVIEVEDFGFQVTNQEENDTKINKIKQALLNFSKNRPYVLQVTSQEEKVTKIFYKEETSDDFTEVNQQEHEIRIEIDNFSCFLCSFFYKLYNDFAEQMLYDFFNSNVQNSLLILRYLRILEIKENFYELLICDKIATDGTKAELLAVLDAPFENGGRELSIEAQNYLSKGIGKEEEAENVITIAIANKNADIIEYIMSYCTHLIQQLPFIHQIEASTAAFKTKQFDVLCDLLEVVDFPFPKNFKINMVRDQRLREIINDRTALTAAINEENFEKINEFINSNLGLKFLYNPDNKSSLKQAVDIKKYGVFYYLKSLGFQGEDCVKILDGLTGEEINKAIQLTKRQRKANVNKAHPHVHNSVFILFTRSLIHNKRISKENEMKYRDKIREWLECIQKIAQVMIDVAASCENLKIIFDFESISVENVALKASSVFGTTYTTNKWIFIGAKLSDTKREQEIKGILAHELCHYVMRLVYDNREHPYHKHETKLKEEFEVMVKTMNIWPTKDSKPDDECNGIISEVFRCYIAVNFQPELIVRVVHILAEFDNDDKKTKFLQEKYKTLFDYWQNHVILEMQNFLKKNQATIKLNGTIGLLSRIAEEKIEFSSTKDMTALTENKLVIVTTNVPKLLLINIHKYIRGKFGDLYDTKNLFIEPKELCKPQVFVDFNQLCIQNEDLNIFVDCTTEIIEANLSHLIRDDQRSIFLVSSEIQRKKLIGNLNKEELRNITEVEINYNWSDLTAQSQKLLLKTKFKFENNSEIPLFHLLMRKVDSTTTKSAEEQENEILKNFSEIIDTQTLNLLMEKSEIIFKIDKSLVEKSFELLYQLRAMVEMKYKCRDSYPKENSEKIMYFTQHELLEEVKGKTYILLSDIAGSGKSWTMKYFANVLRVQNPSKWVIYVDLKKYIKVFRAQKVDFLNFIIQNVLNLQTIFEIEIYKKLYKIGKVLIIFDGFDEIAPDCAEFVSKFATSFEFNGGNQLWIATRDYFQVDLQKKLHLDVVYTLGEFTDGDGINFIIKSWILKDLGDSSSSISKDNFDKLVKNSEDFEKYENIARKLFWKVKMEFSRSVGLPHIFKMIADVSEDDKENAVNLKESELYKKFIEKLYNRWLREKGLLREEANTKNLKNDNMGFWQFHSFHAIKSMFPKHAERFFPHSHGSEWPEEEVIAFGLMSKSVDGYYFLHETFREYFVADLIAQKMLEKKEPEDYIIELFVEILTMEKHEISRKFLNNLIENYSTLQKFEQKDKFFYISRIYKMDSFRDIFFNKLEHLIKFVTTVLNTFDIDEIFIDDLKELIEGQEVFHNIIGSSLEVEKFEEFVTKIEEKTGRDFITKMLLLELQGKPLRNIFDYLNRCSNITSHKMRNFLKLMKKYVSINDILEYMKNGNFGSILQNCIHPENPENFEVLWMEIKKFFKAENSPEKFKELVKYKDSEGKTVLFNAAFYCHNYEFHATFWKLLLDYFKNREELKNFILEDCGLKKSFVYRLVVCNQNPDIVEMIFTSIQKDFTDDQFKEIIWLKTEDERNLIHAAASSSYVKITEFIWKYFRFHSNSDEEFLRLLKEVDKHLNNILHQAVRFSPKEVFEFILVELKKFLTRDEIKEMLSSSDVEGVNLLQKATWANRHLGLHEYLWETFIDYFEPKEILGFIRYVNGEGDNLIHHAVGNQLIKECLELTWNKIKSFMTKDEQIEYLKTTGKKGETLFERYSYCYIDENERKELVKKIMKIIEENE